jgi:Na+-translocating ferredoxin:NAD+ oxidoreductase subunit A
MMEIFLIFVGAMLVNNFVLSRFLGICSFFGISKKIETAVGMGLAVTFVMAIASVGAFGVYKGILVPLKLEYLYNIAFIVVIAALVQLVEMFMKKYTQGLYKALGIFLPLITTNCAILGVVVINMQADYNLIQSLASALGAALGYMLAIVLFAGIRERLEKSNVPEVLKGLPITMITAGLMSIAFLGFNGLIS